MYVLFSRICIVFNIDLVTTPALIRSGLICACSSDRWCVQLPTLCPCGRASNPVVVVERRQVLRRFVALKERSAVYMLGNRSGFISGKRFIEGVWSPSDIQRFPSCLPAIIFVLQLPQIPRHVVLEHFVQLDYSFWRQMHQLFPYDVHTDPRCDLESCCVCSFRAASGPNFAVSSTAPSYMEYISLDLPSWVVAVVASFALHEVT